MIPAMDIFSTGLISPGTSLEGTTLHALMDLNYVVTFGLEVENWTKFPLTDPVIRVKGGVVSLPPRSILPARKEALVTHKTPGTATGSYGTVSWLVEAPHPCRVVVMWSAPFDFTYFSNWLAVGLTEPGAIEQVAGDIWFNKMYYSEKNKESYEDSAFQIANGRNPVLQFTRKEYSKDISPAKYQGNKFEIVGNMGSTHQAKAVVQVLPRKETDLASHIKLLLQNQLF